jgi:hypothetical protein
VSYLQSLYDFVFAWLSAVNAWIFDHQPLVISVVVPLLTLFVTQRAGKFSERSSARVKLIERRLQSEMRIAEFRQVWINDLRSCAVEIARNCSGSPSTQSLQDLMGLITRAELLVNPKDKDYPRLREIFDRMRAGDRSDATGNLREVFQSILKREWDRLKDDLAKVETAELP